MDVRTAPNPTTTRTPPPSRPRQWPSNADIAARRRAPGHDDTRSRVSAPAAPQWVETNLPAAGRRSVRVIHRRLATPLDRARLMLLAALFAAGTAAAAPPDFGDDKGSADSRVAGIAVATPAPTTTPACSPIAVDCCAGGGTMTLTDLAGDLRPTCP